MKLKINESFNSDLEMWTCNQSYGDDICPICHKPIGSPDVCDCVDPCVIVSPVGDDEGVEPRVAIHKHCWNPSFSHNLQAVYDKYAK